MAENTETNVTIEQLNSVEPISLDEFNLDDRTGKTVLNRNSNLNAAAQASVLSKQPFLVEDNYNIVASEMGENAQSAAAESLVRQVKLESFEGAKQELAGFLADENFSDEEKQAAASVVLDPNSDQYNPQNTIATQALIDEDPNAQPEAEAVRLSLADSIFESQKRKKAKQQLLNQAVAGSDSETVTALMDFTQAIVPFVESKTIAGIQSDFENEFNGKAMLLLGSAKADIIQGIRNAPKDQQLAVVESLINVINTNSSLVMQDPNDFIRVNSLRTFLEDGYYDSTDQFIDNVVSVLDMTIIGGPIASGVKFLRKGLKATGDMVSSATRDAVRSNVQPGSVSQTLKDTNVSKGKAAHVATSTDESGSAAEALYGTSRLEAVGNDLLPEVGKVDKSVNNKLGEPDLDIVEIEASNGAIHFTEAEKAQLREDAVSNLVQVKGMTARKEMFSVENVADGVNVRAVYGPTQGGVSNATDAMQMAEWAMRDLGVTSKDLQLLVRNGDDYVPTTIEEFNALSKVGEVSPGVVDSTPDFLIGLDMKYKFNPADVTEWSKFDVKYNLFDRLGAPQSGKQVTGALSSIQRYALDPHSMLDPTLTGAANVAVDKSARMEAVMLKMGDTFGKEFNKLPKDRKGLMEDIIKEQNHSGNLLTRNEMTAQGVTPKEQQILSDWKAYWDNAYHLENRDLVKNFQAQGFKEFVDQGSDSRLFVRPLRRQDAEATAYYNQKAGRIEYISAKQLDDLYEKGGELARTKDPVVVHGDSANFIVVENKQAGSYTRALNNDSQVLNYREGYYTVNYTDPYFIVKNVKDGNGKLLYTQALATAGNIKDADLMLKRMQANDPDTEFFHRRDLKDQDQTLNDRWDVSMNTGRGTQKVRGERLNTSAASGGIDPSQAPILGPVDSLIHSARSVSQRVSMREMIETSKLRTLDQYAEFMPPAQFGRKMWPESIEEVKYRGHGQQDNKRIADARTTWEYVNYLENGYVNAIDATYKSILKSTSSIVGSVSSKAERGLQWLSDGRGPSSMGKNIAFNAYLATNPLRQAIVQSHQAVQLFANFPKYMLSVRGTGETAILAVMRKGITPSKAMLKASGMSLEQATDMFNQFKRSGLSASIEKQNLVRQELSHIADERGNRSIPFATSAITTLRKVGFDAGEHLNMMTAWLAHRDRAIKQGKSMKDSAVADTVSADARNYTYNMNAAGDMKYNQDSLAVIFQFMQVPHKSLLQMATNRNLSREERLRLSGFNALMYTLPPAAIYNLSASTGFELPEDPTLRDAVVQGLEGVVLNKLLSETMGEGSTDFSGLAPTDMFGLYEFIHSAFTTDIGTTLASTPSGQLLFGGNPRLTNFAKTAARYFNLMDDYEDTPTTLTMVAHDFGKISSGYSNAFKAKWELEFGRKVNGLDMTVTQREAMLTAFGFGSTTEAAARWTGDKTYKLSAELKEDVKLWYADYKKQLFRDGITPQEEQYVVRSYAEAWRVWSKDTDITARQEVKKLIGRDLRAKDDRMFQHVMRASNYTTNAEFQLLIDNLPDSESRSKEDLQSILDFAKTNKEL